MSILESSRQMPRPPLPVLSEVLDTVLTVKSGVLDLPCCALATTGCRKCAGFSEPLKRPKLLPDRRVCLT